MRQLRRAKDAMDRDWAEPLDLDAVAAHAGYSRYSRYHFLRAFKEVYGLTPGRYLGRRRIERAEELRGERARRWRRGVRPAPQFSRSGRMTALPTVTGRRRSAGSAARRRQRARSGP